MNDFDGAHNIIRFREKHPTADKYLTLIIVASFRTKTLQNK